MRALVFGGSGFIGRHVCSALREHAEIDDVQTPGHAQCDLLDGGPDDLTGLLAAERPDIVINCTGKLSGSVYELVQANTVVTAKLIEAVGTATPEARLIRLGSAGEYGVVQRPHAANEDDPARPVSAYGASHLAGTNLMQIAAAAGDIDGVVLRVFNPIGAGLHQENMLGRAVELIKAALRDGADHIDMGPLSAWRDFVDVRDLAAAVCAAALAPTLPVRVFNAASGIAVPSRHVLELLATTAGFTGEIRENAPAPSRSAAVDWMCGDISLAESVLHWSPTHDLSEAIKAVWSGVDDH